MAKVRRYTSMPLAVLIGSIFTCAITSPAPAATVTQGTPVTITGTTTAGAVAVQVKLGATVLGSASIVGLDWSYSWTPQAVTWARVC
jgi:Zn-dependent alcohol dehydrogenase